MNFLQRLFGNRMEPSPVKPISEEIHRREIDPATVLLMEIVFIKDGFGATEKRWLQDNAIKTLNYCCSELLPEVVKANPQAKYGAAFETSYEQALAKANQRADEMSASLVVQARAIIMQNPSIGIPSTKYMITIFLHLSVKDEDGKPFMMVSAENWRFVPFKK